MRRRAATGSTGSMHTSGATTVGLEPLVPAPWGGGPTGGTTPNTPRGAGTQVADESEDIAASDIASDSTDDARAALGRASSGLCVTVIADVRLVTAVDVTALWGFARDSVQPERLKRANFFWHRFVGVLPLAHFL